MINDLTESNSVMMDYEDEKDSNSGPDAEAKSSFEIELKIVSTMLKNPQFISYASTRLTAKDFENSILRIFFNNIVEIYNKNEKTVSLDFIKERIGNESSSFDAIEYEYILEELSFSVYEINLDDFKKYIDIKKCQAIKNQFIIFSNELSDLDLNTKNIEYKLNELNSDFFSITSSWITNAEGKTLKALVDKMQEELRNKKETVENWHAEFNSPKFNWCLNSVITFLDGFNKKQLYVLAARPGMGKSTLALNWALAYSQMAFYKNRKIVNAADKRHCVLFFTLEMSSEDLTNKIVAMVSYLENTKIQKRTLNEGEMSRYLHAVKNFNLHDLPLIFMDDGDYTLSKIESIVREMSSKYIVDLVVIDYLQLIKVGEEKIRFNMNRANEVAIISKTLKTMALSLNIPILALSQLSRRVESNGFGEGKRPMLSDLRESGSIEQDADVVMFLYIDQTAQNMKVGEKNKETYGITFTIEKNRFGAKGTRELEFAKFCSRFEDHGIVPGIEDDD